MLESLAPRLPKAERDVCVEMWQDEEGLVADIVASTLVDRQMPVTRREFEMLRELLDHFDLQDVDEKHYPAIHARDAVLAAVHVVDRL